MYEISFSLSAPSSATGYWRAAAEEEDVARRRRSASRSACTAASWRIICSIQEGTWRSASRCSRAASGGERAAQPAELHREQVERGELGRERLGRGDADLRAGVRVERAAVALARDRRADHVADRERLRAARLRAPSPPRACRRSRPTARSRGTGRARRRAGRGSGTRSRARPRPGCARAPRSSAARRGRRATGAAGDDDDAARATARTSSGSSTPSSVTSPCSSEARPRIVSATARGCSKISLCMKCLWPSFSAATGAPLDPARLARRPARRSARRCAMPVGGEDRELALLEEDHLARVLEDRRDVGGEEALALAEADDERRGVLRGDDLAGPLLGDDRDRVGALHLRERRAHRGLRGRARRRRARPR